MVGQDDRALLVEPRDGDQERQKGTVGNLLIVALPVGCNTAPLGANGGIGHANATVISGLFVLMISRSLESGDWNSVRQSADACPSDISCKRAGNCGK